METLNKNKKYQVHPDDVDVRGWNVVAGAVDLGEVNDLVLDTKKNNVRYLDLLRADDNKNYHYLIPLNRVNFNRHKQLVNLETNSHHFLDTYPRFTKEVPENYEGRINEYFSYSDNREYPDPHTRSYEEETLRESKHDAELYSEPSGKRNDALFEDGYADEKPENLKSKIDALEKQKQTELLKKLELERDITLIDEEIIKLKGRLK